MNIVSHNNIRMFKIVCIQKTNTFIIYQAFMFWISNSYNNCCSDRIYNTIFL